MPLLPISIAEIDYGTRRKMSVASYCYQTKGVILKTQHMIFYESPSLLFSSWACPTKLIICEAMGCKKELSEYKVFQTSIQTERRNTMKIVQRHYLKWEYIEPAMLAAYATDRRTGKPISAISNRETTKTVREDKKINKVAYQAA